MTNRPELPQRYEVIQPIGAGYVGSTWLVFDKASGKKQLAKVISKTSLGPEIAIYADYLRKVASKRLPLFEGQRF